MREGRARRGLARALGLVAQTPRVGFYRLLSNNKPAGNPKCFQPLQTVGLGSISFGENVRFGVEPSPLFFSSYAYVEARHASARVSIGAHTWLNNNFRAIADHTSITIGEHCLIGTDVEILDSDFHGMSLRDRHVSKPESARPVTIGDHVFLGSNVRVLKGVTIGDGAVVSNGSIVVADVPARTIAGGVPAKVLRAIE